MTDIDASLGRWIQQVIGKYINVDWNPENRGFGAQCWDLAANWSMFLGLPVINTGGPGRWPGWAGNMVDAFPQTPEIGAAYQLVGPDEAGRPGDIAVWGDSNPAWYPKTHVAVLVMDKGAWLQVMSQNSIPSQPDNPYPDDSTGPTTLQPLPRRGLLGFIRPTISAAAVGGTISPQSAAVTSAAPSGEDDFLMALSQQTQAGMAENSYLNLDSNARIEAQNRAILETLALILPAVARLDTRAAENVDIQGRIEKNQALMLDSQAASEALAAAAASKGAK